MSATLQRFLKTIFDTRINICKIDSCLSLSNSLCRIFVLAGKLPSMLVGLFFYALPFVEVAVGAMLVLGLFNVLALILSGLLLTALRFGTVMKGDFPTTAHNVSYALVNSALLRLASYNGYSLDRLLHRGRAEYEQP
jgi:hypothetical protein